MIYINGIKASKKDIEALKKALRDDTILVSVMAVNNEIGTIQPLDKIGQMIKEKNPDILFHVDAIQGFGKIEICQYIDRRCWWCWCLCCRDACEGWCR